MPHWRRTLASSRAIMSACLSAMLPSPTRENAFGQRMVVLLFSLHARSDRSVAGRRLWLIVKTGHEPLAPMEDNQIPNRGTAGPKSIRSAKLDPQLARIIHMTAKMCFPNNLPDCSDRNPKPPSAGLLFVVPELTCSANIQVNPRLSLRTQ